ncbi:MULTISPECIES: hypothetical protein [unclassified Streptomyces]|uniref:hypothetical protein n=1 Tax=unclassified Streptomyces TaxID=2593676 RepID=UPI0024A92BEB|nr:MULTISPECIES: hypothetical protein [unclassified Streptomyces]
MTTTPTTPDRPAEVLAATIETVLRESLPVWWQTPPRLDQAALAVARQLLGTTSEDGRCPVMAPGGRCEKDADHRAGCWPDDPHVPAAPPAPADRAATCICGHPEPHHFEDVCQTCDCGDYIEPQDAREVIARWRQAALANRDLRRATTLHEAAEVAVRAARACGESETGQYAASVAAGIGRDLRRLAGEAAAGAHQTEQAQPELTATLVINRTDSYCDGCRKPTLPKRTHHTDISGWSPVPGGGCGARFTATRSDYRGITADDLKDMRPDLPVAALAVPAAPEETTPAPQCSAGLLPATDEAVDRCVRHGAHDTHATAAGVRWPNEENPEL